MKRKVAIGLGSAACFLAAVAAAAPAEDVGGGCVGKAVSASAHSTQQFADMGFGAYVSMIGQNPGQLIKAAREAACTVP